MLTGLNNVDRYSKVSPINGHPGDFRNISYGVSVPFIQMCSKRATICEHSDICIASKKGGLKKVSVVTHGDVTCKVTTNVPTISYEKKKKKCVQNHMQIHTGCSPN